MRKCFDNLLQYNDTANCNINRPNKQQLVAFKLRLEAAGLEVKMRESRGNNIKAACGQLVSNTNEKNKQHNSMGKDLGFHNRSKARKRILKASTKIHFLKLNLCPR